MSAADRAVMLYRCRRAVYCLIGLFHLNTASFFLALAFPMMSTLGESHEATNIPFPLANLTQHLANLSLDSHQQDGTNSSSAGGRHDPLKVPSTAPQEMGIPREFPTALVVAASIAAVCILVFFLVSYIWHTRQLDSRARKLAIRLAADSEHATRCANCTPPPQPIRRSYMRAVSESSQEPNMCEALTGAADDDQPTLGGGSEGGRSSVVVSESDTCDLDDIFDATELPPPLVRGARVGSRSGRSAHRKWSRASRKSSGPASLDGKRDSAVTDKEILSHFANRRHSTFFI